jgi:hypothetical protein
MSRADNRLSQEEGDQLYGRADPDDYEAAVQVITVALRDQIGAHGPINHRYSRSTAKRIAHALATANPPAVEPKA